MAIRLASYTKDTYLLVSFAVRVMDIGYVDTHVLIFLYYFFVKTAVQSFQIKYPVILDNNYVN
jgi:hypothetical protein